MNRDIHLFSPARILILGFMILILLGSILLSLPVATVDNQGLNLVDAVFTSTSAVCVTGLVVVDIGTHLTFFGQLVILGLMQLGGLGFMSITTLIAIILSKKIGMRQRILIKESLNQLSTAGIIKLVKQVVIVTLLIQGIGAVILTGRFLPEVGLTKAVYYGVFHSVSAFVNAGFDLLGTFQSFTGYIDDWVIGLTLPFLIILGGFGFSVLIEIINYRKGQHMTLHTKVVLSITILLVSLGTLGFMGLEWTNPLSIGNLPGPTKILASFFQGVSPRTAGFSTINLDTLQPATLFFITILMFIGASPGGTGGGVKTTTFAILLLAVRSELTGRADVEVFSRRIPASVVSRALSIVVLAMLLILMVTLVLSLTEHHGFLDILFEVVSAFGTVGLSTGITPTLTTIGRLLIALVMFVGRVGPITLGLALAKRQDQVNRRFAEEPIIVG